MSGRSQRDIQRHIQRCSQRPGFALFMALVTIALVTALLLGTAWRVAQDTAVARAETLEQRALDGAETALWQTVVATDPAPLRAEPIGTIAVLQGSSTDGADMTTQVWITRVDTTLVWLTADATVRQGVASAYHRVGLSAMLPAAAEGTEGTRLRPIPGRAWVDLF